jgi:hypothetical protein
MLEPPVAAARMPIVTPRVFRSNRIDAALLGAYTSQTGQTLAVLAKRPLFLVFLRHFGCTFCRKAVADLSERRRPSRQKVRRSLLSTWEPKKRRSGSSNRMACSTSRAAPIRKGTKHSGCFARNFDSI